MRNGFCQAGNVISRASRAVSPRLKQVSDEEEVQETEESTSDDEEQDPCFCHTGLTTSRKLRERHDNSMKNVMRSSSTWTVL